MYPYYVKITRIDPRLTTVYPMPYTWDMPTVCPWLPAWRQVRRLCSVLPQWEHLLDRCRTGMLLPFCYPSPILVFHDLNGAVSRLAHGDPRCRRCFEHAVWQSIVYCPGENCTLGSVDRVKSSSNFNRSRHDDMWWFYYAHGVYDSKMGSMRVILTF